MAEPEQLRFPGAERGRVLKTDPWEPSFVGAPPTHTATSACKAGITRAPVYVLVVPPLIQLLAHVLGNTAKNGPSAWASMSHVGDWEAVPGSWL